jgi:drug/metabolite transporter (DMT)-like permease
VVRKLPVYAIIAAIALAANYAGYIKGLDLTSPSNAQIIIQLAPLMLIVVGLVIYKEQLNILQGLGFAIAIVGFGLFYRDQISQLLVSPNNYNIGIAWVVGAALAWVVFASLQKGLVQRFHAQGLNLIMYLVPSILMIPLADFQVLASLSWPLWGLMIFLGLNTLLAYGAIAEAFRFIPANKVGIIVTVNPIITIITMGILSAVGVNWIEPERISVYGFLGAALIVTGVIIAIVVKRKPESEAVVDRKLRLGLKR